MARLYVCPSCGAPMPAVVKPGVVTCIRTGKGDVWTRERLAASTADARKGNRLDH